MLRFTSAVTRAIVTCDAPMPKVVTGHISFCYSTGIHGPRWAHIPFVARQSQRSKCANPFVTRQESKARLGIYLRNSKSTSLMQISSWLLDRAHKIAATERISCKR